MANINIKKVFIVLTHKYIPSRTAPDKWEVTEQCEFLSNLRDRHYTSATCIVDLRKERLIKNRSGELNDESYDAILEHIKTTYPNEVEELEALMKGVNSDTR